MELETPRIRNFHDASSYFREFYNQNKKKHRGFSHRQLAGWLKWPASYLHDVINHRKKLTVLRALQFAQFLNLSSLATERLVYFALNEEGSSEIRAFSKRRLRMTVESEEKSSSLEREFFKHIEYEAILAVLVWAGRRLLPKDIKSLLYTLPHLSPKRIEIVMTEMESKGWIAFDEKDRVTSFTKDVHLDERKDSHEQSGIAVHEQYGDSFVNYTKAAQIPGMYNSGFYEIPRKDFMEIAHRLLETRNWLMDYVKAASETPKKQTTETLVFQFDLNLFTILDKTKIDNFEMQKSNDRP